MKDFLSRIVRRGVRSKGWRLDSRLVVDPRILARFCASGAFTLLELLAVIAIIGILASLLFPGIRATRLASDRARTRVQFSQWAAAIEAYRGEYGYYPVFHGSNLVNPAGQATDPSALHLFHDLLAARRRDGSSLPAFALTTAPQFPEIQNRRLVSFFRFSDADFSSDFWLREGTGSTAIAVLVDRDLDGFITAGNDFAALPAVNGLTPTAADFPATGIRAGVVFYCAAPGATAEHPEFIFSWK